MCRPLYQVPADSAEASSASSASATPGTPSTTSNPGRIQKPSRKQSNLQAAPNNIAKALKIEPQQADTDFNVTSVPKHSSFDMRSPEKPLVPEHAPQPHIEASTAVPKTGGCCSQNPAPAAPAPSRSCCSSKESPEPKEKAVDSAYASWAAPSHMEPLLWNSSLQNGHYSSEAPGYTGLTQPSSSYVSHPDSNSPIVSQPHYMPNMQIGNSFDAISLNQLSFNHAGYPSLNLPSTFAVDKNHDCSCGETCQCLGCASHPYNETTRQHVQKMGFMMSIDEDNAIPNKPTSFIGPDSSPLTMSPNGTTHTSTFADNTMFTSPNFDNNMSSGGNAFATDQFMQPSEYYEIEYSVGLSLCSNVSGTCQCGNDCNCVGCLTHDGHNGVALQPSPSEQHQHQQQQQQHVTREIAPQRLNEYTGYTTNIPHTLDQYSPSALSPQIVEAPFV